MSSLIDPRTLAFVACIGGYIMAATMAGMRTAGSRNLELAIWAAAGFVYGTGYLAGHLLLTLAPEMRPWLAGGIANGLITTGHLMLMIGVQHHLGQRRWWWALLVPPAMLAMLAVPEYRIFPRAFVAESAVLVAACLVPGVLMWRANAPGLTRYRRATALVFLLFAAFFALRAVWLVLFRNVTASFDPHLFQVLVFLGGMLFAFVLTIGFVVLVFRGKELDLREAARRDPLTGLLNRQALSELAQRELSVALRQRARLSLVAIDIDHFKQVNDQHGHAAGDQVLVGVARALATSLRSGDLLFRVGGEEFLVLLPFTGGPEAVQVAERLRRVVGACEWRDPALGRITASLGVAELDPGLEEWSQALQRVDQALYAAKAEGRDQVKLAPPFKAAPRNQDRQPAAPGVAVALPDLPRARCGGGGDWSGGE